MPLTDARETLSVQPLSSVDEPTEKQVWCLAFVEGLSYPEGMYTIKRAAELTGVPVATLRAWERRYGIGTPARSDSGYRLYDEQALADIHAMQHLIEQGWAPRQAAEATVNQRSGIRAQHVESPEELDQELQQVRMRVLAAARSMDEVELGHALDLMFTKASYEYVVDNWLMPVMKDVGDEWLNDRLDIAGEHFVSNAVMRRLGAAFESSPLPVRGPLVLVGLPAGSYHEIGSIAFATAARRIGLAALYLGSNVPTEAWVSAVAAHHASAIVLSVVQASDVAVAQHIVETMTAQHPQVLVAVGGRLHEDVKGLVMHLPGSFSASAANLAQRLMG